MPSNLVCCASDFGEGGGVVEATATIEPGMGSHRREVRSEKPSI